MNDLILYFFEKGQSNLVYDFFGILGIITATIFCVWLGRKFGIKLIHIIVILTITLIVTFFSIHIIIYDCLTFLSRYISVTFITSIIRTLLLIPMVGFWLSKILKIEWAKICDMLACVPMLIGSIGCFGCVFAGCCRGYPFEWGIYNARIHEKVFPVQLLNALIMLAIAGFLIYRAKRNNYISDGLSYPIMLILFGSTRFLTEFLSDNSKMYIGLSALAIHSILDLLIGSVSYFLIIHKAKK